MKSISHKGKKYIVVEELEETNDEILRIKQIRDKLEEFNNYNLNCAIFGYCKIGNDYIEAQYLRASGLADIEVAREMSGKYEEFKKEHKLLTIICSYLDELTILLKKHPNQIETNGKEKN